MTNHFFADRTWWPVEKEVWNLPLTLVLSQKQSSKGSQNRRLTSGSVNTSAIIKPWRMILLLTQASLLISSNRFGVAFVANISEDSRHEKLFSELDGSTNHRLSNILDHASSEQHKAATSLKRTYSVTNYMTVISSLTIWTWMDWVEVVSDHVRPRCVLIWQVGKKNYIHHWIRL